MKKKLFAVITLFFALFIFLGAEVKADDGKVYGFVREDTSAYPQNFYVEGYLENGSVRLSYSEDSFPYLNIYQQYSVYTQSAYYNGDLIEADKVEFGNLVEGYVKKGINVRDSSDLNQVAGVWPARQHIKGIKIGSNIRIPKSDTDSFLSVYDFGLLRGRQVSGYLERATYLRNFETKNKIDLLKAGDYIEGVLVDGYIQNEYGGEIYNFGLLSGKSVSGYISKNTNARRGMNGNVEYVALAGEYVSGIKLSNGYIKTEDYDRYGNHLYIYDFGLLSGQPVNGYLEYSSAARHGVKGEFVRNYPAGTYIEGTKLSNGYIVLDNGLSIYDFGILKGSRVSGYIPAAANIRNAPNGKIVGSYYQYKQISGIKNGNWIALYNGKYIYDFGLIKGEPVRGYASRTTNARISPTGKIVGSVKYGDLIQGNKVGNYIHLKNGRYIYNFGLLKTTDVKAVLKSSTNIRDGVNGKLVDTYPAGTYIEGKKFGNWIALNNGFYLYDLGLNSTNRISTKTDIGLTFSVPSQKEVYDYYHNYKTGAKDKMNVLGLYLQDPSVNSAYSILPNEANFNPGKLTLNTQKDALHVANTFRYSVGIRNVSLNSEFSRLAQAGSFLNYLNGGLSHFPEVPKGLKESSQLYQDGRAGSSSSNISYGSYTILDNFAFMRDDSGYSNIESVGHRGWMLNPKATEFGVGGVYYQSHLRVFQENPREVGSYVLAYPNRSTAVEWMTGATPLSVFFSDDFDISNAKVTLTDVDRGSSTTYTSSNGLRIFNYYGYGHNKALIFGQIYNLNTYSKYRVKITGVTRNGAAYPIEYTINFFRMSK